MITTQRRMRATERMFWRCCLALAVAIVALAGLPLCAWAATVPADVDGVAHEYSYGYDLAGRLTDVWRDGNDLPHRIANTTFDPNGNRLSRTLTGGTVHGAYDEQDRLTSYGTTTYLPAASGEWATKTDGISGGVTQYTYDALGNLTRVDLPNGSKIEYIVDGIGRRIGKKVNGVLTRGWLYRSRLQPVAELDGTGAVVSVFVYGLRLSTPEYMVKGGVTYRILTDHLGSPRLVVDAGSGVVVQRLDYDEWGRVTLNSPNLAFQPFGFAGGLYDPDTKLVRFGVRDYDAETARWTSKDPLLFAGGAANLFEYCGNDPVNCVDPTGMFIPRPDGGFGFERAQAFFTEQAEYMYELARQRFSAGGAENLAMGALAAGLGGLVELTPYVIDALPLAAACGTSSFDPDQTALIELAKGARRSGVSTTDAETLSRWANEYQVTPADNHIGTTHWVGGDHIRVGPINHVPAGP